MIGPLLVLVAHGLDLLTFGMALQIHTLDGEVGVLRLVGLGPGGLVLGKIAGAGAMAWIVNYRRLGRRRQVALAIATAGGIIGTLANLTAL
jgi:hypothetical protein